MSKIYRSLLSVGMTLNWLKGYPSPKFRLLIGMIIRRVRKSHLKEGHYEPLSYKKWCYFIKSDNGICLNGCLSSRNETTYSEGSKAIISFCRGTDNFHRTTVDKIVLVKDKIWVVFDFFIVYFCNVRYRSLSNRFTSWNAHVQQNKIGHTMAWLNNA